MRITMCADAQHLTVAFESGHVVLARFRTAPEKHYAAQTEPGVSGDQPSECSAGLERGRVSPSCVGVRCAVRAFAESALACWWSGHRVLACSAEGELHCYEAALAPQYSVSDVRPCVTDGPLKLQLLWSATLRKGIGSVCLQANLVVAGCWDSTLRLYDARDGRLLSILSYQRETINEVRMAPAAIARVAAFGFDVRQPRCYAPPPVRLMLTSIQDDSGGASCTADCGHNESSSTASLSSAHYNQNALAQAPDAREEELVYLFASASKDGTVALWRVDMQLVAEKAALKIMPA
ncbi:hypothetical protein ABL78_2447 [Leptomonas seymouri]|uniref:Uncharacterized protein n=1 Tax=Leptomonas seymouri TaxID=5684 RepID=A0A0N1I630_LEPSE|nr:hypothetical protein ABL78_2447 [Leptomonas seymouri]|eukprot:KPI88434.1 hypothetical protein ABL78_2447 [Leptomonas seymouri]